MCDTRLGQRESKQIPERNLHCLSWQMAGWRSSCNTLVWTRPPYRVHLRMVEELRQDYLSTVLAGVLKHIRGHVVVCILDKSTVEKSKIAGICIRVSLQKIDYVLRTSEGIRDWYKNGLQEVWYQYRRIHEIVNWYTWYIKVMLQPYPIIITGDAYQPPHEEHPLMRFGRTHVHGIQLLQSNLHWRWS